MRALDQALAINPDLNLALVSENTDDTPEGSVALEPNPKIVDRLDLNYYQKRQFAYCVWRGERKTQILKRLGLAHASYKRWKKDPLVIAMVSEFDESAREREIRVKAYLGTRMERYLQELDSMALDPSTPSRVRKDVLQDLLDREGTLGKSQPGFQVNASFTFTDAQILNIGSSLAESLTQVGDGRE